MEPLQSISKLISKFLKNELTTDEKNTLDEWAKSKPQNKEYLIEVASKGAVIDDIRTFSSLKNSDQETWTAKLERNIYNKIKKPKSKKNNVNWYAAASVLLFFACGIAIYFFNHKIKVTSPLIMENEVVWISAQPTLSIKNGKIIPIANYNKVIIDKEADGIDYTRNSPIHKQPDFNTLSTPVGCIYKVILNDGTKVTLNAASSITFPVYFEKDQVRKVDIRGEAFLEVAKKFDSKGKVLPFVVNVDNKQTISVKGTEFNVNSYSPKNIYTTLIKGLVHINTINSFERNGITLLPGKQIELDENGKFKQNDPIDLKSIVAWKENLFQFKSASIQEIMENLERWYNVSVIYKEIPNTKFSIYGLSRHAGLRAILEKLTTTGEISFVVSGNRKNGDKEVIEVRGPIRN